MQEITGSPAQSCMSSIKVNDETLPLKNVLSHCYAVTKMNKVNKVFEIAKCNN